MTEQKTLREKLAEMSESCAGGEPMALEAVREFSKSKKGASPTPPGPSPETDLVTPGGAGEAVGS